MEQDFHHFSYDTTKARRPEVYRALCRCRRKCKPQALIQHSFDYRLSSGKDRWRRAILQYFEGNSQAYQKAFHQLKENRNPEKRQSRYNRNKVSLVLVKSSISVVIPLVWGHICTVKPRTNAVYLWSGTTIFIIAMAAETYFQLTLHISPNPCYKCTYNQNTNNRIFTQISISIHKLGLRTKS